MKNKYLIGTLILASTLILSACKGNSVTNTTTTATKNAQSDSATQTNAVATIVVSDAGASPKSVIIKAGDSINWVNKTSRQVQIGSADHPTHAKNPQLTGGEFVISLAPGESKVVNAGTNKGTWGWHDHLKASVGGTIVVN